MKAQQKASRDLCKLINQHGEVVEKEEVEQNFEVKTFPEFTVKSGNKIYGVQDFYRKNNVMIYEVVGD